MRKLLNKETGEKYETTMPIVFNIKTSGGGEHTVSCESIKELNEKWEDVEEPKEYWTIDCGMAIKYTWSGGKYDRAAEAVGLKFDTKEECDRAIEELKALKRLKDKGFRLDGWEDLQATMGIDDLMLFNRNVIDTDNVIGFRMDDYHDCIKDLNICFGGE